MSSPPPPPPLSFSDFPEDVQLNILSFLTPAEISSFACTSRRSSSLSSSSSLYLAICHRRWGPLTSIRRWSPSPDNLPRLYHTLDRWDRLIGFWRRIGQGAPGTPPVLFFEWGPSFITGSRVSPSPDPASYAVLKVPFLWMGLSRRHGDPVSYLHPGCRFESPADFIGSVDESDLVPVTVSFMGPNHFVVEENRSFYADARSDEIGDGDAAVADVESSSPPEGLMSELYQYFANPTSPGGDKGLRRQRKKKGRQLFGKKRWESEHFVKIENYSPTPERPLQGLWKGICEGMNLDFYLVAYDDIGGVTCRRVGDVKEPFSGYSPVFWTSNTTFLKPPFSREEQRLYTSRLHIRPVASDKSSTEDGEVSRILYINSSYDLVIPDLTGSVGDPRNVEGRIWEYEDGMFGFGFLRNNFIVDLKHVALGGRLLDAVEYCFNVSTI